MVPSSRCPAWINRLLHLPGHMVGSPNLWPWYSLILSSRTHCVIYPWFIFQVVPLRYRSVCSGGESENKSWSRQKPIKSHLCAAHPNLRVCSLQFAVSCTNLRISPSYIVCVFSVTLDFLLQPSTPHPHRQCGSEARDTHTVNERNWKWLSHRCRAVAFPFYTDHSPPSVLYLWIFFPATLGFALWA